MFECIGSVIWSGIFPVTEFPFLLLVKYVTGSRCPSTIWEFPLWWCSKRVAYLSSGLEIYMLYFLLFLVCSRQPRQYVVTCEGNLKMEALLRTLSSWHIMTMNRLVSWRLVSSSTGGPTRVLLALNCVFARKSSY